MIKTLDASQKNLLQYLAIALLLGAVLVYNKLNTPSYAVTQVTAAQAKTMVDNGAVVFDVREPDSFSFRHIPGAISLPLSVLEAGIPMVYENLKEKEIVVYCGDGVTRGPKSTDILNKAGYTKAVNLKPGIQGWEDAGYAMVRK